ncbi:hypothetical protein DFH06DRAFT_1291440 [Mycena polygramma]|nr:hypothetical protein DFH06DRAFT_1291440 [Mycena polygramma]
MIGKIPILAEIHCKPSQPCQGLSQALKQSSGSVKSLHRQDSLRRQESAPSRLKASCLRRQEPWCQSRVPEPQEYPLPVPYPRPKARPLLYTRFLYHFDAVLRHAQSAQRLASTFPRSFTDRVIAGIACQVRFNLSSMQTWNRHDGHFNYEEFFWRIVDLFKNEEFAARTIALYNRVVLGNASGLAPAASASTGTVPALTHLERLQAARAARSQELLYLGKLVYLRKAGSTMYANMDPTEGLGWYAGHTSLWKGPRSPGQVNLPNRYGSVGRPDEALGGLRALRALYGHVWPWTVRPLFVMCAQLLERSEALWQLAVGTYTAPLHPGTFRNGTTLGFNVIHSLIHEALRRELS